MAHVKPFFSIIIPALNEAKYLPHLLTDLSQQSFRDFEVIVVDGHSNDTTVAKAKSLTSKLPKLTILNSPRRHVCTQRNLGAKHAHADVLIFMDADNRLPPFFLQGIKYRWESLNVDILTTWLKPDITKPSNETIATAINLYLELQNNLKPIFLLEAMIVISKKCFFDCGGFDESINYAEGKTLIKEAINRGYVSHIVRDPAYIYSFRRLRKFGSITMSSRVARMEIVSLLGQDPLNTKYSKLYPMLGGTLFNKSKRAQNTFLRKIYKLIQNF